MIENMTYFCNIVTPQINAVVRQVYLDIFSLQLSVKNRLNYQENQELMFMSIIQWRMT